MTIEVFQWHVSRDGQLDQGVCKAHLDLTTAFGAVSEIKAIYLERASWALRGLVLDKVADVESDNLEHAFERTNNIEEYWGENADVTAYGGPWRSTSVGDVMCKNGEVFVVSPVGFTSILNIEAGLDTPDEPHRQFERISG